MNLPFVSPAGSPIIPARSPIIPACSPIIPARSPNINIVVEYAFCFLRLDCQIFF